MAKSPGTTRKKVTKPAEAAPPVKLQRAKSKFFQPRQLIAAAFVALALLMIPVVISRLPKLDGRPEYQIGPDQVMISPPPGDSREAVASSTSRRSPK